MLQQRHVCQCRPARRRNVHLDSGYEDLPFWSADARRAMASRSREYSLLLHRFHPTYHRLPRRCNHDAWDEPVKRSACALLFQGESGRSNVRASRPELRGGVARPKFLDAERLRNLKYSCGGKFVCDGKRIICDTGRKNAGVLIPKQWRRLVRTA